jgi:hypothetical protein
MKGFRSWWSKAMSLTPPASLKFILRNAAQHEIYSWTAVPVRASLPPGEGVGFRTRLASPPADARDVVVRFVNRRDLVAANR